MSAAAIAYSHIQKTRLTSIDSADFQTSAVGFNIAVEMKALLLWMTRLSLVAAEVGVIAVKFLLSQPSQSRYLTDLACGRIPLQKAFSRSEQIICYCFEPEKCSCSTLDLLVLGCRRSTKLVLVNLHLEPFPIV